MTEPGWYFGFLCKQCGISLPSNAATKAAADTGARPIAIGAWEIRCPVYGLVANYGGGGKAMTHAH